MENRKLRDKPEGAAIGPIGGRANALTALALVSVMLAGCSSVPDALNPVEWYKGARDMVTGGDKTAEASKETDKPAKGLVADRNTPPPGSDKPIPSVASVPDRPNVSAEAERAKIAQGLVADESQGRRYSTEVVTRQAPAASQLDAPRPPQVATAPAAKAPAAMSPAPKPSQQVASAPAAQSAPPPPPVHMTPPKASAPAPSASAKTMMSGPRPPALAPLPPPRFGRDQGIVVVSGEGVQTVASLQPASFGPPSGGSSLAQMPSDAGRSLGTHSLDEFNPTMARGSYEVANILFANGSAALGSREVRILREVVKQHAQVGGTIRVVGHASSRTKTMQPVRHAMANFKVSVARAESVAKELIRLGVQPANLFVGAVSDQEPMYRESMPSGEAGNRRAEIFIDY